MSIRNRAIDEICRQLKRLKANEFEVRLRTQFGSPEGNTEELLQLMTKDFNLIRGRNDKTNLFVGRFFGAILMIELKLESVLMKVDPEIESSMLGKKIDVYSRLLKVLATQPYGFEADEIATYRSFIGPLRELSKIRNKMAHDLSYTRFGLVDIPEVVKLVKRRKPSLMVAAKSVPRDFKPIIAVHYFAFMVAENAASLQMFLA